LAQKQRECSSFCAYIRLGVKTTTPKDLASKDLAFKAKDSPSRPRTWPPRPRQDDVKANVSMVRCSVKTSKHRRLLQGW